MGGFNRYNICKEVTPMGTAFGTDEEFEALYERHWKYVYRLCLTYMKSAADAEDCTEDVFVKVLTGNYTFTDQVHERKWLTVTAINLCKDKLKSWKRKLVVPIDDEPEPAAEEPEDRSDVVPEQNNQVGASCGGLPGDCGGWNRSNSKACRSSG